MENKILKILFLTVADPELLKRKDGEDNVSVPSSFNTNAHNELYTRFVRETVT